MGWLGGFRNRVTIEVLLATGVLVLTAALAITPPVDQADRSSASSPSPTHSARSRPA